MRSWRASGSPSQYLAVSTCASSPAEAFDFAIGEGSAAAVRIVASPAFSQRYLARTCSMTLRRAGV